MSATRESCAVGICIAPPCGASGAARADPTRAGGACERPRPGYVVGARLRRAASAQRLLEPVPGVALGCRRTRARRGRAARRAYRCHASRVRSTMTGSCGAAMLMAYLPFGTRTIPRAGGGFAARSAQGGVHARPVSAHRPPVDGHRDHAAHRRVPRRRHRDQRPGGRRVRADRGRRGARRRRRAARPLGDARRASRAPLSRGIQRFTGITQAMVDEAPPAEATLPDLAELLRGRVLVAHNASFDRRVLRQAFERAGLRVARPAGRCARSRSRAGCTARAPAQAAPARRVAGHRGRGRAPRARRRRDVRARVLRAVRRGCARTRRRSATRSRCCARRAARRARGRDRRRRAPRRRAPAPARLSTACPTSPASTSSATPRARSLYVGKSVARAHARAGALRAVVAAEAAWTAQAETVDHRDDALRARRARCSSTGSSGALRPPGNVAPQARRPATSTCAAAWTSPFPVLEVAPEPARRAARSRRPAARPRRRGRAHGAARLAVRAAPLRARAAAARAARRPTGRWAAACRRASATSTRTSTAAGSTRRSALFTGAGDGGAALLAHVDGRCAPRPPSAALRARRVAARAAASACAVPAASALGGALAATHARPRLVLAGTRAAAALRRVLARRRAARRLGRRCEPTIASDLRARTRAAPAAARARRPGSPARRRGDRRSTTRRRGARRGWRRCAARAASTCAAAGLRAAAARAATAVLGARSAASLAAAGRLGTAARRRSAVAPPSPVDASSPGAASRRTSASAIGPSAGETTRCRRGRPRARRGAAASPARDRRRQPQAAQVAVGLAPVEQPRDGLLADVAALREAHGALVEAGLLRDRRVVEVDAVARAAALDAQRPRRRPRDRARRPRPRSAARDGVGVVGGAEDVDADVGRDEQHRPRRRSARRGARARRRAAPRRRRRVARSRADSDSSAVLHRALVQLDVDSRSRRGGRRSNSACSADALGVEQQLVAACASTRRSPSILPLGVRNAA